ncbi:MAG: glycosyltransferase family 4 protein [Syntrophomonadaceae bacterium]|nr:glycosyltransferase family 4 protein [Syntrophomonadaceae bacterium]
MTKNVCILTSVHSQSDTRIFYKECKTLADAGYDLSLIVQHEKDEVIDGVRILGIAKPRNRRERMLQTTKLVYERALECDADIYHFHDPELIPVGLRLKKRGKKVIYDVHEDVPRQILSKPWIPASMRNMISWPIEKFENYAAKRFDYIVTATPFIRDRFLKINEQTVDVNNYPLSSELYIPEMDWNHKERTICYVGGISQVRGINEMVEAIALTRYPLLLAGGFSTPLERDAVIQKKGWDQVIELGQVDRNGVKEVLSRSMAGLVILNPIPNYLDALPVKMFEYMAAGIPVIASRFPLWEEIVEGNQCGICVDPLNIYEIADAISWIMDNPEQAKNMGENGRRAVEEKYNWETEGKKLFAVYEKILR